jgi:hypothetical protein
VLSFSPRPCDETNGVNDHDVSLDGLERRCKVRNQRFVDVGLLLDYCGQPDRQFAAAIEEKPAFDFMSANFVMLADSGDAALGFFDRILAAPVPDLQRGPDELPEQIAPGTHRDGFGQR